MKYKLKIIDKYKNLLSARIVETLPGIEIEARSYDKIIFLSTGEQLTCHLMKHLQVTAEKYLKPEFDKVVVIDGPLEPYMLELIEEEQVNADPETEDQPEE